MCTEVAASGAAFFIYNFYFLTQTNEDESIARVKLQLFQKKKKKRVKLQHTQDKCGMEGSILDVNAKQGRQKTII